MIIKRKLFSEIEKYVTSKQAIVVTGMRRVGKTTLLNYFFQKIPSENKLFLDLENPLNREIFEERNYERIKLALSRLGIDFTKKAWIFLDEIQLLPQMPSIVKYFYDHYDVKFFLTGSASFYLKNLFSETLSGRKYLFELYPLDFEEFLWFKGSKLSLPKFSEKIDKTTHSLFSALMEEYLVWGGMPEVVLLENPQEKKMVLNDIFSSYFQKEVQMLGDFRKIDVVRKLILLLARRIGQKLDIQKISQELGVSRVTVYNYLDLLSATYFLQLVPAFGGLDIEVRKQRKVYFVDCGFISSFSSLPKGSVFENLVYQNLRNQGEVFYYQKGKGEIDFILKTKKDTFAFEVKETATASDIKKLKRISESLGIKNYFVVSLNFSPEEKVKYAFQLSSI